MYQVELPLTYGFYNSIGGDRVYDAEQFGSIFNGIIRDGIYEGYRESMKIFPGSGRLEVQIGSGRAWFNGTWIDIDERRHSFFLSNSTVDRTWYIYVLIDKSGRRSSIAPYQETKVTEESTGKYWYLMGTIDVPAGSSKVTAEMITDLRGSGSCPFASGLIKGTVVVDETLTVPGAAPDSKVVGDMLRSILARIEDYHYVPVSIKKFFNKVDSNYTGTTYVEIGRSVTKVDLTWAFSRDPVALSLNGIDLNVDVTDYEYVPEAPISPTEYPHTVSWTLRAIDERAHAATAVSKLIWTNGVYYGVVKDGAAIDRDTILSLTKDLRTDYNVTFTVNPTENQRVVMVMPVKYGTPTFKIGAFDYSWEEAGRLDFENSNGFVEQYVILQHPEIITGRKTITAY